LAARSVSELEATVIEITNQGGKAIAVPTDVTNGEHVSQMVQKTVETFGRIDVLINVAGGAGRDAFIPLLEMEEEKWDSVVDLNLKSVYLCSRAVGRVMVEQKSGSIINFSSGAGTRPVVGETHYGAAKAGVNHFTRVLATEWGRYNIRVNAISPGLIATQSAQEWVSSDLFEKFAKAIPLGRAGQPEDILGAALFLTSDASAFVSGVIIPVGGGPE
jgi:NAD(P)-dependent dehydrogenase (short-subunit alcohol dehydrogenase family)